ncbi:MAG: hypothetical protein MJZ15_11075 [Bacteroidales bacterium]|nr:hypothetical protein [Bacteroidales bacterium]
MHNRGVYLRPYEIAEALSLNEQSVVRLLSRLLSKCSFIDRRRYDESPGHFYYEYSYIYT